MPRVARRTSPPLAVLEGLNGARRDAPFLPVELVSTGEVPALYPRTHGRRPFAEESRHVGDRKIDQGGGFRGARRNSGQPLEQPVARHEGPWRHGGYRLAEVLEGWA